MKTALTPSISKKSAFSLVEMLLVVALLGIVSAMAVPMLAVVFKSDSAQDHRNAQALAAMAGNAIASGNLSIPAAGSVDEAIDLLVAGVSGTGVFEGTLFRIGNLNVGERAAAAALLSFEGGLLLYSRSRS